MRARRAAAKRRHEIDKEYKREAQRAKRLKAKEAKAAELAHVTAATTFSSSPELPESIVAAANDVPRPVTTTQRHYPFRARKSREAAGPRPAKQTPGNLATGNNLEKVLSLNRSERGDNNKTNRSKKEALALEVLAAAGKCTPRLDMSRADLPEHIMMLSPDWAKEHAAERKSVELREGPYNKPKGTEVSVCASGTYHASGLQIFDRNVRLDANWLKALQPRHRYRVGISESKEELWAAFREEFPYKNPTAWLFKEGGLRMYSRPVEYVVKGGVSVRRMWHTPGHPSYGTAPPPKPKKKKKKPKKKGE